MGIISRCFCDPHKLTYVSAIVTAVEGVLFGVLNIVLLCMHSCVIPPPPNLALGFDKFWAFYFYDRDKCNDRAVYSPWWTNYTFPLDDSERSVTTVQDNYLYQIIYLCLHAAWVITAVILIYGNARKKAGFYLPWLLVSTTILVMDITISAFYIQDLVTVSHTGGYDSAMFWVLALYFRLFIGWFINMSQYASAFNAFCKTRHKRAKQEHQRRKMAKAHAQELASAQAATEARVRAQMAQQAAAQALTEVQARPKIPPPVPKKPAAPPELRPFNYLNPAFRPNDATDIEGMRAHSTRVPDIPIKPLHLPPPKDPYFPDDNYSRSRHLEGTVRRYDSMRNYRTQERHPAFRRYSSTRGHPNYPESGPYMPPPDYDKTLRPLPSFSNHNQLPRASMSPRSSSSTNHYREGSQSPTPYNPHHYPTHDLPHPLQEDTSIQKTLYYV